MELKTWEKHIVILAFGKLIAQAKNEKVKNLKWINNLETLENKIINNK
tara:strand:- start:384 stop:527 length:144 start_codon:yes stop_codon:yes gene_type:complete